MTGSFILATDYVLPARAVSNDALQAAHPTWRMSDVAARTGVATRHWAETTETSLDLAEAACRKLFERTGIDSKTIDAVLFCTQSPDYVMPPNACLLQARLGLSQEVAALDYSLACSGFAYGLLMAHSMVASGTAAKVLLVTAETYSKLFSHEDRGPATLFGDGGAATVITGGRDGLSGFVVGTDGRGGQCFWIPAGGARTPRGDGPAVRTRDHFGNQRTACDIHMNGAEVLTFVKREIPPLYAAVLDRAKLEENDVDLVLLHQASQLGIDAVYDALSIPNAKRFTNVSNVGNTVSASLPILLRDAELAGKLKPGMRAMILTFGVGWSWAGCVVTWQA